MHYTMGDLLATQLAQFAIISRFDEEKEYNMDFEKWYIVKNIDRLINIRNTSITNQRTYSFTFNKSNETTIKEINNNIYCGNIKLSDWNNYLASNNLEFNPVALHDYELTEERNTLLFNKQQIVSSLTELNNELKELLKDEDDIQELINNPEHEDWGKFEENIQRKNAERIAILSENEYYRFINKRLNEIDNDENQNNYPTITFNDTIVVNPLKDIIPDTNNLRYMLEITPNGQINIDLLPNKLDLNILYYWNGEKYKVYNHHDGEISLYKYGKFTKNICIPENTAGASDINYAKEYLKNNQLNSDNYNVYFSKDGDPDEIIDGIITFHPMATDFKIRVNAPLKYT